MQVSSNELATWETVLRSLDEALDLEPEARRRWLEQLTVTQPRVAATVGQLLDERERLTSSEFINYPPLRALGSETVLPALQELIRRDPEPESSPASGSAPASGGTVVGRYRLIREIGHGGMSSVWLAERSDGQPKRQVAVKLPFVGHGRLLADHFKRECEILATLTHPNIARLYDAEVTASGQPYLAMEYVQGHALTDYCDSNHLTVRQRLELFLQALTTVGFAHERLVLHRDLKPSNILVTAEGRVVLLDFGIAKLLSEDAKQAAPLTEVVGRIFTPDYASPEHIAGKPLSTSSDVYSLGVLLYELLTGRRPFSSQDQSRRQLEEAILTLNPPQPSRATFTPELAVPRNSTSRKLSQALKGDLDTILLKALKKDPAERYRTVEAFAQDISNHLSNLPVLARPDSTWYRVQRFIARHRLIVATASITTLAVVGGSVAALYQARMAGRERDRAYVLASRNETIEDFTETLITDAASSPQPMTVSDMLARSETVALADTSTNPEDRAAILAMIANRYFGIGDVGKASDLFDRAQKLLEGSRDIELKSQLSCSQAYMLAESGNAEASNRTFAREFDGPKPKPGTNAMACLFYRAMVAQDLGDGDAVLLYGPAALEEFHKSRHHLSDSEATILGAIATGYHMKGQTEQANHYYELAVKMFADIKRESTANAFNVEGSWAVTSLDAGLPKRAVDLYDRMLGSASSSATTPAPLLYSRARALQEVGRYEQAREGYEAAQKLAFRQHAPIPQAYSLLGLAAIALQSQQTAAASDYVQQAAKVLGTSFEPNSSPFVKLSEIRGRIALAERRLDEAREDFQRLLTKKGKSVMAVYGEVDLAEVDLASNDPAAAENAAREALEIATSLQGGEPYSNLAGLSWLILARAHQMQGRTTDARHDLDIAISHLSNTVDETHIALLTAREMRRTL